jgi:predicted aldo/keto reductase-like oxidoreductase
VFEDVFKEGNAVKKNILARREFLKSVAAGAAVLKSASLRPLFAEPAAAAFRAMGLPTVRLGKTRVKVPRIGLGLGSRFCAVEDLETALGILNTALDYGFYYWDTAYSYRNKDIISEERLGRVLKSRRRDVFLATKCESRTREGILREFEESLKRLQTDYIDLYQVHLVQSLADVETMGLKNGAYETLRELKAQKAVRFIGFTGHLTADGMAEAARRYDFDTMLIALNHYLERKGDMEGAAVRAAARKKMGVMVIKTIRPREAIKDIAAEDLIRYGLSLPSVHAAVVGTDSVDVVAKNAALLKDFKPLTSSEMNRLTVKLEPFHSGDEVPWMQPGYRDGQS